MTENVHFPHDHPESQDKLKCRICTVYFILFFPNQFNTHEIKHFRYRWTKRLKYQKNRRQNSQQTPSPKDQKIKKLVNNKIARNKKKWMEQVMEIQVDRKLRDINVDKGGCLFHKALSSVSNSGGNLFKNRPRASSSECKQLPINLRLFQNTVKLLDNFFLMDSTVFASTQLSLMLPVPIA